jgi:hypothetical protein
VANDSKKESYMENGSRYSLPPRAVGLGLLSVASALAGGLAVAWWYRKTLTKLQNPIISADIQKSEFLDSDWETTDSTDPDILPHLLND